MSSQGKVSDDTSVPNTDLDAVAATLAANPDQVYLRRRYGLLLFRRRNFKDAAAQFSQWARLAPGDNESFLFLSRTLLRLDMYDFARAAAEMAGRGNLPPPTLARTLRRIEECEALASAYRGEAEDAAELKETIEDAEFSDIDFDAETPEVDAESAPNRQLEIAAVDAFDEEAARAYAEHLEAERAETPSLEAYAPRWNPAIFARDKIDAFLSFVALIDSLIKRNIAFTSVNKFASLINVGGQMALIVILHVVLFYVINRRYVGQIALLPGVLAPFINWNCFKQISQRVMQRSSGRSFNRNCNIKWIHLFIADAWFDLIRLMFAAALVIIVGDLFFINPLIQPIVTPNIPLIVGMLLLSLFLGIGFGTLTHAASERWPIFESVHHVILKLLFISCGLYESYLSTPPLVEPFFKWNPLLTVTEYTRVGFDGSYPVGDLTPLYPIAAAFVLLMFGLAFRASNHLLGIQHVDDALEPT